MIPKEILSNKPLHFGKISANTVFDWMPSDSEESYQRMIQDPAHQAYFAEQGWDKPGGITYRINNEGFRGDNFDYTSPGMIALGCSFTFGIGLPEKDIWPTLVGQSLGLKVANLSWGGIAADSCFRLAAYWVPRLRPKIVVMLTPPPDRFEVFLDPDWATKSNRAIALDVLMPQSQSKEFEQDSFFRHWWLNNENSKINRLKNQLALKQVCQEYDIPCMIYCCFDAFGRTREEVGYARDYMHAGPPGHKILANRILNDWNEANRN